MCESEVRARNTDGFLVIAIVMLIGGWSLMLPVARR